MRGVYIHIPFCNSICSYCDFCKFLNNEKWANNYLESLNKEIDTYYEGDAIKSIYIGGGTPSALSLDQLEILFNIIRKFKTSNNLEFTFECNVNNINKDLLSLLKENGVNRLSVGVESFNKYILKYLNRKHDKKQIIDNISLAKKYFDNISVDIIYALNIEDMRMLKSDINSALKLGVNHISTYSLIIEPHTAFYNKGVKPIDEELDYKMYKYINKKLKKNGYIHYEVSNYSKFGYESKHNLTYWDNGEYYGFGISSHGFINSVRYENTRNLHKYFNGEFRFNEVLLSNLEDMENELMLGLRKIDGISISKFRSKFGIDVLDAFPKIRVAITNKYMEISDDMLYIVSDKIYVMNEILNMIL